MSQNIKSVLSKQLGNHNPKSAGAAPSHSTGSGTMDRNANTKGNASGAKQGTLAAAAKLGSNGYK